MSLHPRLVILASQLGLQFTCEGRVNVPPGDGLLAWGETLAGAGSDEESPQIATSEFFPRVRCGFVLRVDMDEPTGFGSLSGLSSGPWPSPVSKEITGGAEWNQEGWEES